MPTSTTWARLRKLVKNRDKSICYHCKQVAEKGHCDHLIPISKGGTDEYDNLVWSCADCNIKKGNKLEFAPLKNPLGLKPDYTPLPRSVFKQDILSTILIEFIRLIIHPYPEYSELKYPRLDDYRLCIRKMRRRPITTWLREIIWTNPLEADDYIHWQKVVAEIETYEKSFR